MNGQGDNLCCSLCSRLELSLARITSQARIWYPWGQYCLISAHLFQAPSHFFKFNQCPLPLKLLRSLTPLPDSLSPSHFALSITTAQATMSKSTMTWPSSAAPVDVAKQIWHRPTFLRCAVGRLIKLAIRQRAMSVVELLLYSDPWLISLSENKSLPLTPM